MVEASLPQEIDIKPEEKKEPSKNQIEKERKKLKNKTRQAITVLCSSQDTTFDKLVSVVGDKGESTGRLFVTHFGNGDEND